MREVFTSNSFRREFDILTKKKYKKSYGSLKDEIIIFFDKHTFDELFNKEYYLRSAGDFQLKKFRLPNSTMKKGASGGFRIIVLLNSVSKNAFLLFVYPKTGVKNRSNIQNKEEEKLVENFFNEQENNLLECFQFPSDN